jgi:cytochrome P450
VVLDFKHASALEGVRFTAQVGVPNVLQGLFRRRETVVRVAGVAASDQLAYRLTAGLVRKYGPDPFYVRVAKDEALLVSHPDDIRRVLEGSPSPFASDPDAKKKGMTAFQPDALTISRGDLWANRRAFADAVLDTGKPLHRLADGFAALAVEEADGLLASAEPIQWEALNSAFQRLTRRVVLGTAAADDTALSEQLGNLMAAGNKMPGKPDPGYADFEAQLQTYVDKPDPDALTGLIAGAPQDGDTRVAGQLVHWLFAMGDTLPANLFRALALLATHPASLAVVRSEFDEAEPGEAAAVAEAAYTSGCLLDAMRLWPTTALFGRVLTEDYRFPNGELVKEGTQVLIHNLFNHRNRERIPFADTFAPEEWAEGDAASDWSFNFFSNGPQGCPGAGLSIFLGTAFLARLATAGDPKVVSGPRLKPATPLPYTLDIYGLSVGIEA